MVNGYHFDPDLKIWKKSDFVGIAYSDGEKEEEHLAAILTQVTDKSIHSPELIRHCTDWLTCYHFSALRSNLLRPFAEFLKGDVLEIGAGCGALTRYMAECGGQILALEGSIKRASIAASRICDLKNATVVAESLSAFQTDLKFDVVTLIGVLEYANLFMTGENPHLSLLSKARSLLKPNGRLILAIENQFGLKYFCGAKEDHVGQAMYGIEGFYKKNEPQTFGRFVLIELLQKAGLEVEEFLYPFPDYKFPRSILTQNGCSASDFDSFPFIGMNIYNDLQLPINLNFDLFRTWKEIVKNKMVTELSNSFLISSMREDSVSQNRNILVYHYTTSRKASYSTQTIFRKCIKTKNILIEKSQIYSHDTEHTRSIFFHPKQELQYMNGNIFLFDWIITTGTAFQKIKQLSHHIQDYIRILCTHIPDLKLENCKNPYTQLPGKYIDAIPRNIIIQKNGDSVLIDQEWEWHQSIDLGFLLFKAFLDFFNFPTITFKSAKTMMRADLILRNLNSGMEIPLNENDLRIYSEKTMTRADFMLHILNLVMKIHLNENDLRIYSEIESELQEEVIGRFHGNEIYQSLLQPLCPPKLAKMAEMDSLLHQKMLLREKSKIPGS